MPDPIKESFSKVKEDVISIKEAINILSDELNSIRNNLYLFNRTLNEMKNQTDLLKIQTDRQITPTDRQTLQLPTPRKIEVSIGNKGVPTDRQTDQQTDRHIQKFALPHQQSPTETASTILNSLDTLKKDLRLKFKKLTPQELNIFSLIYQLEDQGFVVDYPLLAQKTNLSQSSIRDYTLKLISKGVPLDKKKENNKQIALSIPQNFKKIASLDTILRLKEL